MEPMAGRFRAEKGRTSSHGAELDDGLQGVGVTTNLDGINSWRKRRLSVATSPKGCMLPPVSKIVSLYTPVAGEHGREGAAALVPRLCAVPV